jgi:hypothetical protein
MLAIFLIAFSLQASAVDPVNPESLCDRFIKPTEKTACERSAKSLDLDWYAASVCNLVNDDQEFLNCWKKIDGQSYSPSDLASCAESDIKDTDRTLCLIRLGKLASSQGRLPSSLTGKKKVPVYQELKIKKR